jgi:hypothetical protein
MEAKVDGQGMVLPGGFEDLAPFVSEWGELRTQGERHLRRQASPMDRLTAYYDAVCPRLASIFEHLDSFPFDAPLPEPESRLLRLAMGMTEVAQAVEVLSRPVVAHGPQSLSLQVEVMTRV